MRMAGTGRAVAAGRRARRRRDQNPRRRHRPSGSIIASARRPTSTGSGEAVLASTLAVLQDLADALDIPIDGFDAVGVGIPGLVDIERGTVRHAVNLGLGSEPLELGARLSEKAAAPSRWTTTSTSPRSAPPPPSGAATSST